MKKKEVVVCITCLPVIFLSPELVTTTCTTSEVAPCGPSRSFSVTYNMPLLRKWAPSLRASNAVTYKEAGYYYTEVKYTTTKNTIIHETINVHIQWKYNSTKIIYE
jgi:hypothetical protein